MIEHISCHFDEKCLPGRTGQRSGLYSPKSHRQAAMRTPGPHTPNNVHEDLVGHESNNAARGGGGSRSSREPTSRPVVPLSALSLGQFPLSLGNRPSSLALLVVMFEASSPTQHPEWRVLVPVRCMPSGTGLLLQDTDTDKRHTTVTGTALQHNRNTMWSECGGGGKGSRNVWTETDCCYCNSQRPGRRNVGSVTKCKEPSPRDLKLAQDRHSAAATVGSNIPHSAAATGDNDKMAKREPR